MPRHYEDYSKDHFDLLPFIAILMCMLGCLLLVTISIAALSMGPGADEGWMLLRDSQDSSKESILIESDGATPIIHWRNQKLKANVLRYASSDASFTSHERQETQVAFDSAGQFGGIIPKVLKAPTQGDPEIKFDHESWTG